ncbi:MAG: PAS domain S-box protein, partial [Dehalococcoidia bacterium]|nr:PAS domain S-box protein [Dehalococcoidia bacterium]
MREPTIERTAVLGACELPWQSEVISSALEGILTVAEDGRLLSMNRAAERLLGVRWADVAGKPIETFIPKRYHAMHRDFVALFLASGLRAREMTARNPVDVRRADGTEFVAEVSLVRISISGKPAAGCIIRDISERRRANQQLRLQAQLLEQSRAAAVAFDSHGKVTYWNGAAEQLYGCSREEALGKTVRELGVVEVPPEVQVAIREAINNDQEWEGDLRT